MAAVLDSDIRRITLACGATALCDAEDYHWLARFSWRLHPSGYAVAGGENRLLQMHRLVMGLAPGSVLIDHINSDRLDNTKTNLRKCSHAENTRNRVKPSGTSSRFKGVYRDSRRGYWRVRVSFEKRAHYVGVFQDEVEAARAYDAKALELHGEFARTNATLGLY